MRFWKKGLITVVLASASTSASSLWSGRGVARYPDIMGCEVGCEVATGGWPFEYLVDYPGISPVGSVSLVEGLLGVNRIQVAPLAASFTFWLAVVAAAVWLVGRTGRLRATQRSVVPPRRLPDS